MRGLLELFAETFDCTIIEEHVSIYYRSLGRSYDETFLTVMHGEERLFKINVHILENWVTPAWLLSKFKGC
jgi:hypothetical protein